MQKQISYLSPQFKAAAAKNPYAKHQRIISYTQFSKYMQCPRRWYLEHIKKAVPFKPNIHLVFGDAMHLALQQYVIDIFTHSAKYGNEKDYVPYLVDGMMSTYLKYYNESQEHFSNPDEMEQYALDGKECINAFKGKQRSLFSTQKNTLHGVELPINVFPHPDFPSVKFTGLVDIASEYKAHSTFDLYDIKTSGSGWSDADKKDKVKIAQALLYKKYFCEQYEIPIANVAFEYVILKRTPLIYDGEPVPRIQLFVPAQAERTCNSMHTELLKFIEEAFQPNGKVQQKDYPATSKMGESCKFCPFAEDEIRCPKGGRL